jgi:hypothetical protein
VNVSSFTLSAFGETKTAQAPKVGVTSIVTLTSPTHHLDIPCGKSYVTISAVDATNTVACSASVPVYFSYGDDRVLSTVSMTATADQLLSLQRSKSESMSESPDVRKRFLVQS